MDESDEPPSRTRRIPRTGRAGRVLAGVALVLLLVLVGVWTQRKPLATRYIDDTLTAKHVPARYTIAALGPGRQRLTNVVLGDPARPDLTADWIETEVGYDWHGPRLVGVRAGRVRLAARLVGGRVSLGSLDRLLPPPSGKPFALPALDVDVAQALIALATPYGDARLLVSGRGRLDDGFAGRLNAVAPRLALGGCAVAGLAVAVRVAIDERRPRLAGPVSAQALACGGGSVAAPRADLDVTLGEALASWRGSARLASGRVAVAGGAADALAGTASVDGSARAGEGRIDLALSRLTASPAHAVRATLAGDYRYGPQLGFAGTLGAEHARVAPGLLRAASIEAPGTPLAPIAAAFGRAVAAAGRDLSGQVAVAADRRGAVICSGRVQAASGAVLTLAGRGVAIDWQRGVARLDAVATLAGGGLPSANATLTRAGVGAPFRGTATMARYAAGGASLGLSPVSFTAAATGTTRVDTVATLSGPLGGGRVEALRVPLDLRWQRGALALDPGCVPLSWSGLAVSGLRLDAAALRLCPTGAALVRVADGGVDGGARVAATRLTGRLGGTPLTLAARGAEVTLGSRGFSVAGLDARLGATATPSLLSIDRLDGRLAGGAVAGRFSGAGGRIGAVPLLLSNAAGEWSLAGGALTLGGGLTVADTAAQPRFNPLDGRAVRLTLRDGTIDASGALYAPGTATRVADVAIEHRLPTGSGHADLTVPGLTFTEALQPDRLTRLTFGVIADVRATVTGRGRIDWSPAGVTSTGRFATENADLAAAFGPVTGLSGTVTFTDLLNLESAPGQTATVASINPGIAVTDGTVTYQLYRGSRVLVNGARWPFAGGTLTLDPTLLDFSAPQERRLTFRVAGAAADRFLQQLDFGNIDATGVFDGVLPMIFDESGGRIEGGSLVARSGGGSLAYVGDLTQKDLGFWGNLAFQSLKSLRYRNLDIRMNGPLAGEMVTDVRFAGVSQGTGARSNFLIRRLQKLPFVFNIRIKAPFRGLLDSAQSFYDPRRLITRNLPALLQEQNRQRTPIQPPASETVP